VKVTYWFRVREELAHLVFADSFGKKLGSVRHVELDESDPRLQEVKILQTDLREDGKSFYFGWGIDRKYTPKELAVAELFYVSAPTFAGEVTAEEFGTEYDGSSGCRRCKSGAEVRGAMRFNLNRLGKRLMGYTLASELLVSDRLAQELVEQGMTGLRFEQIQHTGRMPPRTNWHQLKTTSRVSLSSENTFGESLDLFAPSDFYSCACGLKGLRRLSQPYVVKETWDGSDFCESSEFVGAFWGVFRPSREMFCSPRARRLLIDNKVSGLLFEVANLVEE
jgi:hypothetical protein